MMNRNITVAVASGVFIGVALFDMAPAALRALAPLPALLWIALGVITWVVLKNITNRVARAGLAVVSSLGFWLHSFLEGATVAVSFAIDPRLGVLVGLGMLLHLVPEFVAMSTILRAEGLSRLRSVQVDLVGIVVLWATAVLLSLHPIARGRFLDTLEALTAGAFLEIGVMSYTAHRRTLGTALGLAGGMLAAASWLFIAP